ncbi:MAG: lysoplasmalogenase family protein [Pontixanthobacter sp.]
MTKRALIEHRPWLVAACFAAMLFYISQSQPVIAIPAKGASCLALATYAWRRISGLDGRLLATILAISALADMGLERDIMIGTALFAIAQLIGIVFYLRHRRAPLPVSQIAAAWALTLLTPLLVWLPTQNIYVALYGMVLGVMSGLAWISVFSRYRVGIGVLLLIAAHTVLFAGWAGAVTTETTTTLYWPVYFTGQLLIVVGIVRTFRAPTTQ